MLKGQGEVKIISTIMYDWTEVTIVADFVPHSCCESE